MERLRDCIKEMVKFTLTHRSGFDLELTRDFCFGLLSSDSLLHAGDGIEPLFQNPFVFCSSFIESVCVFVDAETVEAFAGVPEYPLYKRLALSLLKSIASGCFCGGFEKVSLGKEVTWLKEKEEEWRNMITQKGFELVNALKYIACELQVQEPLFSLERVQPRGSLVMINKCLLFEVMEMHKYSFFYELLKAESPEKVFPGTNTLEEGMQMFKKLCDVVDQEKKNNGVVAIHLSKSVSQPCVALSHILSVRSSFFHVSTSVVHMIHSLMLLPKTTGVRKARKLTFTDIECELLHVIIVSHYTVFAALFV
ncbi:hypothetical protein BRARA_G01725 [Brassica rapa]|uniref:Uncharacterized protein n=1 Tax=Brassica campestris TaxID=3711 RepID=A0A397YNS6_BRACM|nr:hypothetical protein BRARA_G01725 [Brassica rapa]